MTLLNNFKNEKGVTHLLLLVAVIGLVAFILLATLSPFRNSLLSSLYPKQSSHAAIADCALTPAGTSCLYVQPESANIEPNTDFAVQVRVNTNGAQINAVQATINYPADLLDVVSIDDTGSAFDVKAQEDFANGVINIVRGSTSTNTGDQLVSIVNFRTKASTGVASVTFDQSSTVPDSVTFNNILSTTSGGNYNITPTATPLPTVAPTQANFSLNASPSSLGVNQQSQVSVLVNSGSDAVNVVSAQMVFDKDKLEVVSIDTDTTFISNWVERVYDNNAGTISLIGGIPNPGYSTGSGNPGLMATVTFRSKSSGLALINFANSSQMLKNSDNTEVTLTRDGVTLNIAPSATPTPTAVPTATPTGTPMPTPTATASPTCTLSNARWVTSQNPVTQGAIVGLEVDVNANCTGKQVSFEIREDDGIVGFDPVVNNPLTASTFTGNVAKSSWVAEFQDDGVNGVNNPPEYYFIAKVVGESSQAISVDPKLEVVKPQGGNFEKGDGNHDAKVNLVDLSIMFSNWNKLSGFPVEIDINDDGSINAFDFSGIVLILTQKGIISGVQ